MVNNNKPVVTSLSAMFKQKTTSLESPDEIAMIKQRHRGSLKDLVEDYIEKMYNGEVPGIRHAKDLIDVMKMDLLLLGEATDRTGTETPLEEIQLQTISEAIDLTDPNVLAVIQKITDSLNNANDNNAIIAKG